MIVVVLSVSCFFFSDKRDVNGNFSNKEVTKRETIEGNQFA